MDMEETAFTAQNALHYGFNKYGEDAGRYFGFFFWVEAVVLVAAASLSYNMLVASQLVLQLDGRPPDAFLYVFFPTYFLMRCTASVLVNKWLLLTVDGHDVTADEILGFDFGAQVAAVFKMHAATLLYNLFAAIGTAVLFVPGLFAVSTLRFYKFGLVDQEMDAVEGLRESYELSGACKGELVSLTVLSGVLRFFCALLLGVGIVPANAICGFAEAYAYRQLQQSSGRGEGGFN